MTNQYALGYKAGLEAAVKVCREYADRSVLPEFSAVAVTLESYIAALPVPEGK